MNFEKPSVLDNQQPEKRKKKKNELDKLNESGPFRFTKNDLEEIKEWEEKKKRRESQKMNNNNIESPARRKFLIKMGLITGAVATGAVGFKELFKDNNGNEQKQIELAPEPTPEQKEIEVEDTKSISEVLDYYHKGRIEYNENTIEAIKNYWRTQYRENPKLVKSFRDGFREMGAWKNVLQKEFGKAGWSQQEAQELMYLAIPESHWQTKAHSNAGASGPYQFIPQTARLYGLKSGYYRDEHPNIDERRDPAKSANACARLLKDLHIASKGDRSLALSGYNGGFIWDYIKSVKRNNNLPTEKERQEINYKGFVEFLEEKINAVRDEVKISNDFTHKVRPKQTLGVIAKKYKRSIAELQSYNHIKNPNNIRIGQKINIPLKNEEDRRVLFEERVSGFAQNLVYPAKFDAIVELIRTGFVEEQKPPIKLREIKARPDKPNQTYIFKKSDGSIARLGKKYGINYKSILRANPKINPNKLKGGEKIIIPLSKPPTLKGIGQKYNTSIQRLKYLNPSIKNYRQTIPEGYDIRM